jgi:hypothetical protein
VQGGSRGPIPNKDEMYTFDSISGEMAMQIYKLYKESWPKFEQVSKKEPTPRALKMYAFDE